MFFFKKSRYKQYLSNTSWLIGEHILRMVVALFVGVYVARYLGPEYLGILGYATSLVGIFSILATLGLDSVILRELIKTPEHRNELLGTAFGLKVVGVLLSWIILSIFVVLTGSDSETKLLIAIIAFSMIFQSMKVIDFYYQSEIKSKYVVYANLVQMVVSSSVKLVFIYIEAPLIWFASVYFLENLTVAITLVTIYLFNKGNILEWYWSRELAKSLLKYSWPLLIYSCFVTINMNIDLIMIKSILGDESAGYYSVAKTLSSTWYFLPVVIGSTFFPYIVREKNNTNYQKRVKLLFSLLSLISISGAIIAYYLSHWVVSYLYGYEYIKSANILVVHIWTGIFVFHVSLRSRLLVSDNIQYLSAVFMFFGLITNILGNYFLIPLYGGVGAAYVSWLSWGVNVIILPLFIKETRNFSCFFVLSPVYFFIYLVEISKQYVVNFFQKKKV